MKTKSVKIIEVQDWDGLVRDTYGKPYSFQQQDGCRERGHEYLTVPDDDNDDEMNESIPEEVNGEEMGVKFITWLARDPKQPIPENNYLDMFWERNFYPDINALANDLHKRGLIEEGDYMIDINW